MNKSANIRTHIANNPGATNADIAQVLGYPASYIAAVTSKAIQRGEMTRKLAGRTLSNVPYYGFYQVSQVPAIRERSHKAEKPKPVAAPRQNSLDGALNELVDTYAETLTQAIVARIKAKLENTLASQLQTALPKPPAKPDIVIQKPRLPKVGVVGLLPQQAGLISQEFCETFDLLFWNDRNGDGIGALKSMGAHCDMVFLHIAHCSHTAEDALKSVSANFTRVGGGMTQLRDALTTYYVEKEEFK